MLKVFLIEFGLLLLSAAQAASAPDKVVALIDGKPISEADLDERAAAQLTELNAKIFEIKDKALTEMIDEQLLNQEAGRLNLSVQQLLDREVDSRVAKPTPADVDSYYNEVKDRISRPLDEIRPELLEFLSETRRRIAYDSYLGRLKSRGKVVVLLAPARATVSFDPGRVRGPANAPITIVEFSDFECPYCGGVEDTLRQLESRYPTQIRLAYRDFPFHPRAEPAAEASRCALAQREYWPYHDLLFDNQQHLENGDLAKYAARLKMDRKQFDECIAHRIYAADVQHDLDEGQKLGITGTPTFFINGMILIGATPMGDFARLIDRELERIKNSD
jgi:protein-disulfide isomerase